MTRKIPGLVFAFFVLCFALHPSSPLYTHHLADPDDYMRLNEVTGWLNGQSWYDLSAPRLSPDAHTVIHWSRLVDLPIALIALPFIASLGVNEAVFIASLITPLLWFAVLLALLPALAGNFVGKTRAPLACVMALFAPMLLFNVTPGRVDHHGIQAIIAGFGLLSLTRIIRDDKGALFAVLSAFFFACGFWIGAEALPWAILFIACLGIAGAWQDGKTARNAALFGICLPLFTTAFIPVALPPAAFSSRALSWFSPAYAIFAGLAGGILVLGYLIPSPLRGGLGRGVAKPPLESLEYLSQSMSLAGSPPSLTLPARGRGLWLLLYILLATGAALAFFTLIPSALNGIFTDYDIFDATTALDNISEAQPLVQTLHFNPYMPVTLIPVLLVFARLLFLPLTALAVCLIMSKRSRGDMRLIWLSQSVFLLAALTLTLFWQRRVGVFMEMFAIAPLTFLLGAWWDDLKWGLWDRKLFWAEIAVFLLLGAAPVVLLPALIAQTPLYPDIILFPAARAAATCPLEPITAFLNSLDPQPLTIMNTSDTGPQLLFATHHRVIAGNFDVPGNADAFAFFHATDDMTALTAARKWKADLVLLCRAAPTLYLGKDYYALSRTRLQQGKDGMLRFTNIDRAQPLIERLIRGETPAWLKPIEIPVASDYLLFRLQYPTGKK